MNVEPSFSWTHDRHLSDNGEVIEPQRSTPSDRPDSLSARCAEWTVRQSTHTWAVECVLYEDIHHQLDLDGSGARIHTTERSTTALVTVVDGRGRSSASGSVIDMQDLDDLLALARCEVPYADRPPTKFAEPNIPEMVSACLRTSLSTDTSADEAAERVANYAYSRISDAGLALDSVIVEWARRTRLVAAPARGLNVVDDMSVAHLGASAIAHENGKAEFGACDDYASRLDLLLVEETVSAATRDAMTGHAGSRAQPVPPGTTWVVLSAAAANSIVSAVADVMRSRGGPGLQHLVRGLPQRPVGLSGQLVDDASQASVAAIHGAHDDEGTPRSTTVCISRRGEVRGLNHLATLGTSGAALTGSACRPHTRAPVRAEPVLLQWQPDTSRSVADLVGEVLLVVDRLEVTASDLIAGRPATCHGRLLPPVTGSHAESAPTATPDRVVVTALNAFNALCESSDVTQLDLLGMAQTGPRGHRIAQQPLLTRLDQGRIRGTGEPVIGTRR